MKGIDMKRVIVRKDEHADHYTVILFGHMSGGEIVRECVAEDELIEVIKELFEVD